MPAWIISGFGRKNGEQAQKRAGNDWNSRPLLASDRADGRTGCVPVVQAESSRSPNECSCDRSEHRFDRNADQVSSVHDQIQIPTTWAPL
jgi:hypothetical protein